MRNMLIGLAGLTLVIAGVGFIYWPAALIAAGAVCLLFFDPS